MTWVESVGKEGRGSWQHTDNSGTDVVVDFLVAPHLYFEIFSHKVKSSQVNPPVISAHSLPPLLASGAHSIGFRKVVCLVFMYRLDLKFS